MKWEIKKCVNPVICATAAVLCVAWFFVCKLLFHGSYDEINDHVYRNYIDDLSEMSPTERMDFVEYESLNIAVTMSVYEQKRNDFFDGKLTEQEYLDYLNDYELCNIKSSTFAVIKRRAERFSEKPELCFFYDLELEGYLTAITPSFPLIILIVFLAGELFIVDIPSLAFLKTCANGRKKLYRSKLTAWVVICAILITAFNMAEIGALLTKKIGAATIPAASMDVFAELNTDISCLDLIVYTFVFRILGELATGAILFTLASRCDNHLSFYGISVALLIIPAFFTELLPSAFKGFSLGYLLYGKTILLDNNVGFMLVELTMWFCIAFFAAKRTKN